MTQRRFIDLSVPIKHNSPDEPFPAQIEPLDHRGGAEVLGAPAQVPVSEFPDGMGLAWEQVHAITHTGTHLDAPWHFGPTAGGAPAKTIDQVPLEWCFAPGVVLDLTHKQPADHITTDDIRAALDRIEYELRPLDIVLLHTGADKKLGGAAYLSAHPGMTREATLWVLDHGVKVMGIDGYGFDRPFLAMLTDHKAGKPDSLWPGHFAGREREYCHIEKLANLHLIPRPHGFLVSVFPVLIANASAGWCRAVAIIED
jgi:kynurenine formamidase